MPELTLEENIRQILPTLPLPIQKFFEQRKLKETTDFLAERYAFNAEQGTTLERELMFLLIGLKNPDEFAAALYEQLPVSEQVVQDILADINTEVFVPLQKEMKKTGNIPQPAKPVMPPAPPTPTQEAFRPFGQPTQANPTLPPRPQQINAPMPNYSGGKLQQQPSSAQGSGEAKYFHLENKIPAPAVPPTPNEKLLEDREEPHIEFSKAPTPANPARPSLIATEGTARTALRPAVASGVGGPPPPNLPGVIQPVIPEIKKPVPPVAPVQPVPVRPYSTDPYREPIE